MSIINGQCILRDKLYQNRIKTGAIFDDLLLSQKKQEVRGPPERITTVSRPHLLRLLSLLIERKADSPTC
jgi:hypothetical protein